jgi:hypothetical protein
MDQFMPCLIRHHRGAELVAITLGDPLLDDYLPSLRRVPGPIPGWRWRRI